MSFRSPPRLNFRRCFCSVSIRRIVDKTRCVFPELTNEVANMCQATTPCASCQNGTHTLNERPDLRGPYLLRRIGLYPGHHESRNLSIVHLLHSERIITTKVSETQLRIILRDTFKACFGVDSSRIYQTIKNDLAEHWEGNQWLQDFFVQEIIASDFWYEVGVGRPFP